MVGRNVWQRDNPAAMGDAFRRTIHNGSSVDEVAEALGDV